jgi:hypothetical protein
MCAVGQTLRAQANLQAVRIRSAAWVREGVTQLDRANMLQMARDASGAEFDHAWCAWQEHYHNCLICQEAMK